MGVLSFLRKKRQNVTDKASDETVYAFWEAVGVNARPNVSQAEAILSKYPNLVNSVGARGETALHHAAAQGHAPMAQLLLRFGATVNAQAPEGPTPLDLAMVMAQKGYSPGHIEVISILKAHGGRSTRW